MKTIIAIVALLAFCGGTEISDVKHPVIVELFTSEGCSSCPPADELLGTLINQTKDESIIALSFHVTYWNHLGWKDPYSAEEYTQRQKKYSDAMDLSGLYTPQMVVDGKYEFVGSDQLAMKKAIEKSRTGQSIYQIEAKVSASESDITVNYTLDHQPNSIKGAKGEELIVALVQPMTENKIKAGENGGRTLKHFNIVRSFKSVSASQAGEIHMPTPESLGFEKGFIVLFVQDSKMNIKGALKVTI